MTAAVIASRQFIQFQTLRAMLAILAATATLAVLAMVGGEVAARMPDALTAMAAWPRPQLGTVASLVAGLATAVGALPVLFLARVSDHTRDTMLGFGAGVMLAATSFSLILPGIEAAEVLTGSRTHAALTIAGGLGLGALFLFASHRFIPHEHFQKGPEGIAAARLKQVWLFIGAITLHNFPEGLAVGVGFGAGDVASGAALALGIGLQNMPEGLVVALALLATGYSRARAFGVALLSGLVEPLGGAFGAGVVALAQPVLPWALAFAAGAMLFVVSHEIIPESHRHGHEGRATAGVMGGFVVMMVLDVALG
jgi:zinc transporter, ZIP family